MHIKPAGEQAISPEILTDASYAMALQTLAETDDDLGRILKDLGSPPMWEREPGFPTLVHIILEQQVSLASARAAFKRLREVALPLTPENFLLLDDEQLHAIGFSRQKSLYCRELAHTILEGQLTLEELAGMDAKTVREQLMQVKGIGHWTADIYLLMALKHADIWPRGDLALAVAVQEVKGLITLPSQDMLDTLALLWKPFRAVAARIFWHYYLSTP
jgi:DNA-3-methyladenine glycosylase II